ncbi:unnamed protein product [Boreogadus saida]
MFPLNGPVFGVLLYFLPELIINHYKRFKPDESNVYRSTAQDEHRRCGGQAEVAGATAAPVFSLSVHLWKYGPRPVFCR